MDDRIFRAKVGKSIPTWDLEHRLSISDWVGPDCQDGATTFRINSTFIEATEQCHMSRHWYAGGVIIAVLMILPAKITLLAMLMTSIDRGLPSGDIVIMLMPVILIIALLFYSVKTGRGEFFARTHYPIRFNRKEQRVYALVRPKKYEKKKIDEDSVVEIEWSEKSIFCVHREMQDGEHYWIRYYQVDSCGNVERTVAFGRDWDGIEGLQELLAQWNYWCWFMNIGPKGLPMPGVFLAEFESVYESFLCCIYEIGFNVKPALRILGLPMFTILAIFRVISIWTCTPPQWPSNVKNKCVVKKDDPFDEPKTSTPVGWRETILAVENKTFSELQRLKIEDWAGEPDSRKNAEIWAREKLPKNAITNRQRHDG